MPTNTVIAPDAFTAAWANVAIFLPKALAFLITLIVGWYVAKFVGTLVTRGLRRMGFDAMVERGGIRQALSGANWDAAEIVGKIAFFTLFVFVLQLAFGFFGPNPISLLLTQTIAFLPNVFVALAIVVVGLYIANFVRQILFASLGGLSYGRTVALVCSGAIMVIAIFSALNQLNIAPQIVNGLFYAMLAIIVGSAVIAIGGGGIVPMRAQWEKAIRTIEAEAPRVREELQGTPERVKVVQEGPYTA